MKSSNQESKKRRLERVVPNALSRAEAIAWGQADPPFCFLFLRSCFPN